MIFLWLVLVYRDDSEGTAWSRLPVANKLVWHYDWREWWHSNWREWWHSDSLGESNAFWLGRVTGILIGESDGILIGESNDILIGAGVMTFWVGRVMHSNWGEWWHSDWRVMTVLIGESNAFWLERVMAFWSRGKVIGNGLRAITAGEQIKKDWD